LVGRRRARRALRGLPPDTAGRTPCRCKSGAVSGYALAVSTLALPPAINSFQAKTSPFHAFFAVAVAFIFAFPLAVA